MTIIYYILALSVFLSLKTAVNCETLNHERQFISPQLFDDNLYGGKVKKNNEEMMSTNTASKQIYRSPETESNYWAQVVNNDRLLGLLLQQLKENSENGRKFKNANTENSPIERAFTLEFENPDINSPVYVERSLSSSRNEREFERRPVLGSEIYLPICRLKRKVISMNNFEYEYRPAHYDEVKCLKPHHYDISDNSNICHRVGFACVQLNTTIHLTRRRFDSDCWESLTRVVPSGCECLWPQQLLGDINEHI